MKNAKLEEKTQGRVNFLGLFALFSVLIFGFCVSAYAQPPKDSLIIDGDTVEYSMDGAEVVASGNIRINYKGAVLTCDKLSLNLATKEGRAEGNARLEDSRGVITGSKIIYNFDSKTGLIMDAGFRSNPYFGSSEKIEKAGEAQFISHSGYMGTCNYDRPHYCIKSSKIDYLTGESMQARGSTFMIGGIPVLYLPQYSRNLKPGVGESMNVQVAPGSSKDWGAYMLTAWRYKINDHLISRFYFDYRKKLGPAQGAGLNYASRLGRGDFKFYYTDERMKERQIGEPKSFQRYLLRWRHQWDIGPRSGLLSEYYKIGDEKRKRVSGAPDFLKDYFYREYEKDSQPLSYALFYHNFSYSGLDILFQKRANRWYDQLEKTPQVRYSLPSLRIANTPFYWENNTYFTNFDKKAETQPLSEDDVTVSRFDMLNKIYLPFKLAFLHITPYAGSRETLYDKGRFGESMPLRTTFYGGAELSTKLYRFFDIESNFLGMGIRGLRHVITPTIEYAYNHAPTISGEKLRQVDEIDMLARHETIAIALSNKLQTKRNERSVDLVDFRVSTLYNLNPQGAGSSLSDFIVDLELRPYSWLSIRSDAVYGYKEEYFKEANAGIYASFGQERSLGIGQRYLREGRKQLTGQLLWRLTPKWKIKIYERYQFSSHQGRGLEEQEYTLTRDLHCWEMDVTYNLSKSNGHTIWFIFRLKAFPEMQFGFEQSYHSSESGSTQ